MKKSTPPRPSTGRLSSGVPGLDTLLGGGLQSRRFYLLTGEPGTGKTVMASQISFHRAKAGDRVVFITFQAESHELLLDNLKSFAFFDPSLVARTIVYLNAYQTLADHGLEELVKMIRKTIQEQEASLLVIDSLVSIREFSDSPRVYRRFLRNLSTTTAMLGCTTLAILPTADMWPPIGAEISDVILELQVLHHEMRVGRFIEVAKHRGGVHLEGRHNMQIRDEGITVFSRLEASTAAALPVAGKSRKKLPFRVPRLDAMLRGGLASGSISAVFGPTGSGKTILGLHFLSAGAREGENGLYFGFYETPPQLVAKGKNAGLALDRDVRRGRIEFIWQPALENNIDSLAYKLLEAVRRRKASRLFLDGIDALISCAIFKERIPRYLTALTNQLKAMEVTTLLSEDIPALLPTPIESKVAGLSNLLENLVLLRYVEAQAKLYRFLSVIKVRESDYDSSIRELRISKKGIDLSETSQLALDILGGPPRVTELRRRT